MKYMLVYKTKKFIFVMALTIIVVVLVLVLAFSLSIDNSFVTAQTKDLPRSSSSNQGKVFVMYAASLLKTFEDNFGPSFQKETGYTYEGEAKGSVQVANMIIDDLRTPDVFVSAGTIPIMKLMNSSTSNTNGGDIGKSSSTNLSEWLVKFASVEMVIAYSPTSHFYSDLEKARIGEIPWYEVVSKQGFKFGRTDPELDPKGYYMIITAKLSNIYYNDSTIKQRILGDDDRNPKQIFPEEILKTILEQGQVDAVAAYKHEAVARGLPYITLPPQINLADPTFSDFYKRAFYTLDSGQIVFGEPIYFSVTIPKIVKNLSGAISFVNFLLSTKGERILESQGVNYIKPVIEGKTDKVPSSIRNVTDRTDKTVSIIKDK
jgi:molybdate/tungstate transport system substrate-binding protein